MEILKRNLTHILIDPIYLLVNENLGQLDQNDYGNSRSNIQLQHHLPVEAQHDRENI
jgi:hypothetical protein